jgi:hypothetical protein
VAKTKTYVHQVDDGRREPTWPVADGEHAVSEFAAHVQGALSPFGNDVQLPVPVESLGYVHPGPAERPNR